ncbi:unnamed protein product [Ixodes persulcatus]
MRESCVRGWQYRPGPAEEIARTRVNCHKSIRGPSQNHSRCFGHHQDENCRVSFLDARSLAGARCILSCFGCMCTLEAR